MSWHNGCTRRSVALRSSFIQLVGIGALGVLSASVSVTSGCEEDPPFTLGTGGSGGDSSQGGAGGAFVDNGAELFAELEAEFVANCAECHEPGGIADTPFLAGPNRYESMLSWPGIVVPTAEESLLLTYSITGVGHTGTNVDAIEGEFQQRVTEWLEAEAAAISNPVTDGAAIDPITPILGLNVIYLTPLDYELEGVAVTFTAEELTPNSLKLSNLQVFTTAATGVHLVHPVFAVYPKGEDGTVDPVDSFADLDQRFDENTAESLGVGLVILTNWEPEAKLGLGFELAEPHTSGQGVGGGGGGGPLGGGCVAVTEFEDNVVAALQPCLQCHGGNNTGATSAVDMSELGSNPAATCGQVKNRVNLDTPAQSQLFLVTNPDGNASHPFKFNGNAGNWNNFMTDVTVWINAE
jgi:hypothetical protein